MKILLVEDDHLQAPSIEAKLRKSFASVRVDTISTEAAFRSQFDRIAGESYDVVVMDVMLRWTDPSPQMEPPPAEFETTGGIYHAGIRCRQMLNEDQRTRHIPVILYSMLTQTDLPDVKYLEKDADGDGLIQLIREITQPKSR